MRAAGDWCYLAPPLASIAAAALISLRLGGDMRILKRKTFNDTLALVLLPLILTFWGVAFWFKWETVVVVAAITATSNWGMLIIQYYFRKAAPNDEPPKL